ncbi:MAG TPA: hypothetical protein VG347_15850 [Verrucomicrobiae bacterium]|nr:hypothetical protein [Verrucomicrobiae bacterium]
MKKILFPICLAAILSGLTQNINAVPITGVIGFSGTAQLDASTTSASTEILHWDANNVTGISSGSFTGLTGTPVILASPWFFNSGVLNNFWIVGAYTFNLASSRIVSNSSSSLTVSLIGTVVSRIAGQDATAFGGLFTVQDPGASGGGVFSYTESLSFGNVPDEASTFMLMGIAACGLLAVKRRWQNAV